MRFISLALVALALAGAQAFQCTPVATSTYCVRTTIVQCRLRKRDRVARALSQVPGVNRLLGDVPEKAWPSVGGSGGPHRMAGPWPAPPPRELWTPPAGWTSPGEQRRLELQRTTTGDEDCECCSSSSSSRFAVLKAEGAATVAHRSAMAKACAEKLAAFRGPFISSPVHATFPYEIMVRAKLPFMSAKEALAYLSRHSTKHCLGLVGVTANEIAAACKVLSSAASKGDVVQKTTGDEDCECCSSSSSSRFAALKADGAATVARRSAMVKACAERLAAVRDEMPATTTLEVPRIVKPSPSPSPPAPLAAPVSPLLIVFQEFDTDNNGFLSSDEIESALIKAGKQVSKEECAAILTKVDANGDGQM